MDAEPVRRTEEIEEATNAWFIHPVSRALVRLFARLHVTPNAVSLCGMACGLLAGYAYAHYRSFAAVLAGFVLMILWHVMDGADGQLARLTNAQSESGKVLDGICDYVTFTAVYIGLASALSRDHGAWVWLLAVVAGACHAVQAAAYEAQRQDYNFWGWNRASAAMPDPAQAHWLYRQYVRIQLRATGVDLASRRKLAAILQSQPAHETAIRADYRAVFAPNVHRWSLMSANYRTLAIFVFAACKVPLYYFYFEILVLSAVFLWLLAGQPARYAAFFGKAAAQSPFQNAL